eukprot:scaffold209868_cov18-Tisochrysis_lutea.AAC.2
MDCLYWSEACDDLLYNCPSCRGSLFLGMCTCCSPDEAIGQFMTTHFVHVLTLPHMVMVQLSSRGCCSGSLLHPRKSTETVCRCLLSHGGSAALPAEVAALGATIAWNKGQQGVADQAMHPRDEDPLLMGSGISGVACYVRANQPVLLAAVAAISTPGLQSSKVMKAGLLRYGCVGWGAFGAKDNKAQ